MDHRTFRSIKSVSMASVLLVALSAAAGCSSGDASGDDSNSGGTSGTGAVSGTGAAASTGGETAGTGSAAATGGDGAGGGSTKTSVCTATNTAVLEAGSIAPAEDLAAEGWDAYQSTPDVDGTAGATITTDAEGELEAGHTSTAFHYAGTGWATYGAGFNVNLMGCKDLSGLTGVKFWAKGTTAAATDQTKPPSITENNLNVRVITPGAHGVIMDGGKNVGGDCVVEDGGCFMPPQKNIALTDEWQQFEIPFADLETPASAAAGSSLEESGNVAMLIGWHSDGGDFDIWVDDVEFY